MRRNLLCRLGALTAITAAITLTTTAQADVLDKLRTSGSITLAYRDASIPFSYLSARKEPIGYSIELCRSLVSSIEDAVNKSLAIKWVPVTSDSRIDAVVSGKVDLE